MGHRKTRNHCHRGEEIVSLKFKIKTSCNAEQCAASVCVCVC